eukprot:m.378839 g.378839  ORF g.378839 m.378839 type:complete len:413 (+) comp20938_c0_seq8:410-1648(+)
MAIIHFIAIFSQNKLIKTFLNVNESIIRAGVPSSSHRGVGTPDSTNTEETMKRHQLRFLLLPAVLLAPKGIYCRATKHWLSHGSSWDGFSSNRTALARNLAARYNDTIGLLAGAHAGGHGFQWHGFSIVDENYFAEKALYPYDTGLSAILNKQVAKWLHLPASKGWEDDRRQNLWGIPTCLRPENEHGATENSSCVAVAGSYTPDPPLAGINEVNTNFAVYSELNNNVTYTVAHCLVANGQNVNHCVPLLLALLLTNDSDTSTAIFQRLLQLWDGVGFGPPSTSFEFAVCQNSSACRSRPLVGKALMYSTRSLGYFLFAARVMQQRGMLVPAHTILEIQERLWSLQQCDTDAKGLPASYSVSGAPKCPPNPGTPGVPLLGTQLTSVETAALALLPYDDRINTTWFPASQEQH